MYGRFLVSFSEKYLANDFRVSSCCKIEGDSSSLDHQLLKVNVPQTNADLFGPAFIEVRNKGGIIIYSILVSIVHIIGNFSIIFLTRCCGHIIIGLRGILSKETVTALFALVFVFGTLFLIQICL